MQLGDDGSRRSNFWKGWYDTKLDTLCSPLTAIDGVFRCIPFAAALQSNEYADANCTQRLAFGDPTTKYVGETTWNAANVWLSLMRIYVKIGSYSRNTYHINSVIGTCELEDLAQNLTQPGWAYVGAEVPPDSFVKIAEVTE